MHFSSISTAMARAGNSLANAARSVGNSVVSTTETWAIPVKLQQLYKGYTLRDCDMSETAMRVDFASTLAALADHIYLTGTRSAHSKSSSTQAHNLKHELGVMFENYWQVSRFDAATGMVLETMGPFGAVIASTTPPGMDKLSNDTGRDVPSRHRIFIVFRGTSAQKLYWDDASTDLKASSFKVANEVGAKAGEVARGFYNTYVSCRQNVLGRLLSGAYHYLEAQHKKQAKSKTAVLSPKDVDVYVVGHSLGGAVATLCAYEIACLWPSVHPILVTFGSPPVGNIDFAIDFNRVMVEKDEYHPRSGELRSIRFVAKSDEALDIVSSGPALLPNYIHVNTRVKIDTPATNRLTAHSMTNSYRQGLKNLK